MNNLILIIAVVVALFLGAHYGSKNGYDKGLNDGISMMEKQAILENKAIINGEYGFIWK